MTDATHVLPAVDPAGYDRPTATASAFAVTAWFAAQAEAERLTLQPLKLQALLFLAQGLFSARTGGRLLMPALFVADERAPVEANVLTALAAGFDPRGPGDGAIGAPVARFLEVVWERFGRRPAADLVILVNGLDAYTGALACGIGTPIGNEAIRRSCDALEPARKEETSAAKPLRTQDGRMVSVKAWQPVASPAAGPAATAQPPRSPR